MLGIFGCGLHCRAFHARWENCVCGPSFRGGEPIPGLWSVARVDRGSSLDQRSRRRPHEAHWQHMSRRRAALAGNAWVSRTRRWSRPSDHEGMGKRHAPDPGLIPRLPGVSRPGSGFAPPADPSTVTAWVMATTGDRNGRYVRACGPLASFRSPEPTGPDRRAPENSRIRKPRCRRSGGRAGRMGHPWRGWQCSACGTDASPRRFPVGRSVCRGAS